ncbi:MAG TPA: proline iminopeptidase [Parvularcula sp.]|nr:proline iminopeptidase [Parvularcula sp.]
MSETCLSSAGRRSPSNRAARSCGKEAMTAQRRTPSQTVLTLTAVIALAACASAPSLEAAPKSGFIAAPGGPVWYEIMGDQDAGGAPLVVLHGGPGGTSCWAQVLAPLGDERPVVRYDQLGGGRSGRPDDTALWNADRFVDELDAVRRGLGMSKMHLLGHSWGATLAAYYVLEKGDEGIVSLTLSSPLISTPRWIADANLLRAQLPADVQRALDDNERAGTTDSEAYKAATAEFYSRHVSRGEAVEKHECPDAPGNSLIYNQMWGPTEFYATGSLRDFDLSARLGEIGAPTLFITGEFDEARPETVKDFARAVPGARFIVIPGVGHASSSRAPDLYRRTVRDFIRAAENRARPDAETGR